MYMKLILQKDKQEKLYHNHLILVFHQQILLNQFTYHFIYCRHSIHTLGHIYLDGRGKIISQIWGHVGFETIAFNHGPPV